MTVEQPRKDAAESCRDCRGSEMPARDVACATVSLRGLQDLLNAYLGEHIREYGVLHYRSRLYKVMLGTREPQR